MTARARRGVAEVWNAVVFAERDPALASVLRIGYGVLLLVNLALWLPDLRLWFGEDGLVPRATGQALINEDAPTILAWFGGAWWWACACYAALVASAILLTVGWYSRIQAVIVLVLLTSFQDRNYAIVDGEDTLFRLYAFYLALCPAGWAYSLDARRRARRGQAVPTPVPWALRLFALQISVVYLSSAIEKALGTDWLAGTAMYYVARTDAFGKLPLPGALFESVALTQAMTWAVLALELALPILLWVPRTRRIALGVAIVFHLAIDYAMHLFLFHWLMILGLLAFAERDELRWPPWRKRPR
jgi:hypothetical protein